MAPKLLINTVTSWDELPRARHQFTSAIAKRIPVVFVSRNKTGWLKLVISHPQNNITLIEPYFPLDHRLRYRLPVLNELYQFWLYSKLKRRIGDLPAINFDFTGTQLVKYFHRQVYYCNDEFTNNSIYGNSLVNAYIARCERKVASSSRFCISTSVFLANKLRTYNPSSYEIPLGVDASYIEREGSPGNTESTAKVQAGLLGFISIRKVSVEIINKILKSDEIQLTLLGPVEDSFLKKIKHPEKLILTGPLKGSYLRAALSTLDVGLATYNLKEINPGGTPNKLWHYFAIGIPTVINKLPNLHNKVFPDKSVYTLVNDDDIVDLILQASKEDSDSLKESRIEFAKQNTWDKRVEKFISTFNDHFPNSKLNG